MCNLHRIWWLARINVLTCYSLFRDGKVITLKEEDSDVEAPKPYRSRSNYSRNKSSRIRKDGLDVNDACGEEENREGETAVKARFPRRRAHNKVKREGDNKSPSKEGEVDI